MKKDPLDIGLTISKKKFILKVELNCHMRYIILTVILMLTTGIAGYTLGVLKTTKNLLPSFIQTSSKQANTETTSPLIESQSGNITGTITAVSGKTLTIVNSKNQSDQFVASDKLVVINLGTLPNSASPSAGLQGIQLNKMALIQLQMEDGQFKVASIAYPPTPPSKPTK